MSQVNQRAAGRTQKSPTLDESARGAVFVLSMVGLLTSIIIVNQFVLRFFTGIDLIGAFRSEAQAIHDAQVFAAWWPVFTAFALASGIAALAVPGAIAHLALQPARLEQTSPTLDLVIWGGVAAALLGFAVALLLGPESLGGTDRFFYYGGIALVWLTFAGMLKLALRYRHREQAFDWLLHNAALANIAPLILPQIAFWPLFGLNTQEAYSTAVTLAPVGTLLVSFLFALYVRNQH